MNLQSLSNGKEVVALRIQDSANNYVPPAKIQSYLPKHDLTGQSVAILGFGKSGISAARLAFARGASVLAIDGNKNLSPIEQHFGFEKHDRLKTILDSFDNELLDKADTVVVSPGGKQVMSELDFAADFIPSCTKILAVTGTNGKSTVATFAGEILDHLDIMTFVGGNLGVPLSEAAYQCLISSLLRPFQVSVILNLTPDHLERHKTMRNYAMSKCHLLSSMSGPKIGILLLGNPYMNEAISEHEIEFNASWIEENPGVKTFGSHNYHNAVIAALSVIALDIGINADAISSVIGKLITLPHRIQIVHKDIHGITWVDDSKATNAEATYTGLLGLKKLKSVVLLGGITKVRDMHGSNGFEQLSTTQNDHRGVITFGSSGMTIEKALTANGLNVPCLRAKNLKEAVSLAKSLAETGDAIVLSPGCASFDEFINFEHRGKVFQELALLS